MIELELKAVVPDADALVSRLRIAGAREEFVGDLVDRRFDFPDGALFARDEVIRVREYRAADGEIQTSLEWKGPESHAAGYKQREEIGVQTGDARTLVAILNRLGLRQVRTIERRIRQFRLDGAVVRMEHYERMDDLVEVEGEGPDIERAIAQMGIPRDQFRVDSLALFARRYEERTGRKSVTGKVGDA
ncbi:MAG TPA: class IV adenylate cyclase [Gemmatimonadaceae bacterium]|nr:class IV adenylate cyclase [Gemmatimonadaceae bacterium]